MRAPTRSGVGATAQRRRRGPSRVTTAPNRAPRATVSIGRGDLDDHLGLARQLLERALGDRHAPRCRTMSRSAERSASISSWVVISRAHPRSRSSPEQSAHDLAALGVHGGGGFVEHEHAGPSHEGQREQRALLLAAAESTPRRRRAPDPGPGPRSSRRGRAARRSSWRSGAAPGAGYIGAHTPPRWSSAPVRAVTSAWSRRGSRPCSRTLPAVGARNPSSVSTRLVLPAPLGPRASTISP